MPLYACRTAFPLPFFSNHSSPVGAFLSLVLSFHPRLEFGSVPVLCGSHGYAKSSIKSLSVYTECCGYSCLLPPALFFMNRGILYASAYSSMVLYHVFSGMTLFFRLPVSAPIIIQLGLPCKGNFKPCSGSAETNTMLFGCLCLIISAYVPEICNSTCIT